MSDVRDPMRLGGTAVAAVVCEADGEDYYTSAWDVWAQSQGISRGPSPPFFQTGLDLEPVLIDWWHREHGADYTIVRAPVFHWGIFTVHLDALAINGDEAIVVDPKMSLQEAVWFAGSDEDIQAGYIIQLSVYAFITERVTGKQVTRCEFPIWVCSRTSKGKSPYMIRGFNWTDERREEARRYLALAEDFYRRHMLTGEPPPFDGGQSAARWLAREIGPLPAKKETADLSEDLLGKVTEWRRLKLEINRLDKAARSFGQDIVGELGARRLYLAPKQFVQTQYNRGTAFLAAHGFDGDEPE
jgi:hypothetical protein